MRRRRTGHKVTGHGPGKSRRARTAIGRLLRPSRCPVHDRNGCPARLEDLPDQTLERLAALQGEHRAGRRRVPRQQRRRRARPRGPDDRVRTGPGGRPGPRRGGAAPVGRDHALARIQLPHRRDLHPAPGEPIAASRPQAPPTATTCAAPARTLPALRHPVHRQRGDHRRPDREPLVREPGLRGVVVGRGAWVGRCWRAWRPPRRTRRAPAAGRRRSPRPRTAAAARWCRSARRTGPRSEPRRALDLRGGGSPSPGTRAGSRPPPTGRARRRRPRTPGPAAPGRRRARPRRRSGPWPRSGPSAAITLSVVPASIRPTVTTTGSNTSNCRVTIACSASTISAATGTGSRARCGIDPWPPRPRTVTCTVSAAASSVPGRLPVIAPVGSSEDSTCSP